MGRSQRDKGARSERDLVNRLKESGFNAKRVPLSGACDGFKGDVIIEGAKWHQDDPEGTYTTFAAETFECKVRKNGFKQLYAWLPDKGVLAVKSDRNEWLIVERLEDWVGRL